MRLIDADALYMYLEKRKYYEKDRNHAYLKGVRDCMKDVTTQPTIKLDSKWIPCSERLPEMGIDVLVCDEGESIWICSLAFDKKALCWEDNCGYIHNFKYWIAWQKLPEPYREGEE